MTWMTDLEGTWLYVSIFLVLYISGAGIPIPEELPLVVAGYLLGKGEMEFLPSVVCIAAALIAGDLTAYWLGRRFGLHLVRVPPFRWLVTPERLDAVKERFRKNEGKAIFSAVSSRVSGW